MDLFSALILGSVEGATEFLPISSTGHMILAAHFMGLEQSAALKTFEVAIQLGSILAVLALFYRRLINDFELWAKLFAGFVPTAVIGFLAYKHIKELFSPSIVVIMLVIGGFIFIAVELWLKKIGSKNEVATEFEGENISYKNAIIIGFAQCLAMVPGTSRSGATIIAGLLCGLSREAAARFSFLLAIPTMFAATGYDTLKNWQIFLQNGDLAWIFLAGSITAFVVAIAAIRLFLRFISRFGYTAFGIYRIALGFVFWIFVL